MGMAATQARLLTITAQIHDVEYQAQSIQNAKLQLSNQSDQVYQEYLAALDATTLTVKDYNGNVITANFNNLCGIDAIETGEQYALRDSKGRLLVSDDIYEDYNQYIKEGGSDAYGFAMYMLGIDYDEEAKAAAEKKIYENNKNGDSNAIESMNNLQESMQRMLADNEVGSKDELPTDELKKEYEALELAFKSKLYGQFSDGIYLELSGEDDIEKSGYYEDDFRYYVSIFNQIQAAGGCASISDYDGTNGDAASNSDWLQNMIQCGKITLEIVNTDKTNDKVTFSTSSPSSDTYVSYTETTSIDKTALAKAEAEYEHATKQIDAKDKQYDMKLSELETEREALTTQHDSLKKVISDNIERTFGIFS